VDWVFNRQILDSAMSGKIRSWFPGSPYLTERVRFEGVAQGMDFLGVNYYGRTLVSFKWKAPFIEATEGQDGEKSDMGWEVYPKGLTDVLKAAHGAYSIPLLVTENGIADQKDRIRPEFIRSHLDALFQAKKEGIPVLGYLHWSLTDNFEWDHGIHQRFGLVEIDYATQRRIPRPSYYSYRELISSYQNRPQ
jgi:beta-galactosidase